MHNYAQIMVKHLHCPPDVVHNFHIFKMHMVITKLDEVIILQYILDGVIRVQQSRILAPPHNKTSILWSRDSAVVWFVLHVTFKSFLSEPPDGVGGVPARYCQPLTSDVDSKTRHCASAGLLQ